MRRHKYLILFVMMFKCLLLLATDTNIYTLCLITGKRKRAAAMSVRNYRRLQDISNTSITTQKYIVYTECVSHAHLMCIPPRAVEDVTL
jgi:hypothetical protein